MKILIVILSLFSLSVSASDVVGTWHYTAFNYEGVEQSVEDRGLDLRFKFSTDGISRLRWHYENEEGFCERQAQYKIIGGEWIYQKVDWIHPQNHISCAKDPDMQLGKESFTKFAIKDEQLLLMMELGDKPFVYILDKVLLKP